MALYFPEKRLFFLERASVFDFNSGGNSNLFYSRRIGLSDNDDYDPEPIRIYGGASYMEFNDVYFNTARVGIRTLDSAEIYVTNSVFANCSGEGIGIYNYSAKQGCFYDIEQNTFDMCTKSIEFNTGDSVQFAIKNNIIRSTATDTAFYFVNATVKHADAVTSITTNDLGNTSNGLVGLDFTTEADANIYVRGNTNLEDKNPQVKMNFENANSSQTYASGVWRKVVLAATSVVGATKVLAVVDSITYISENTTAVNMWISGACRTSTKNSSIRVGVVKNQNTTIIYGSVPVFLDADARDFNFSTNIKVPNVVEGDVFSIWCQGVGGNEDIIFT
jgi:hypothetical protein